MINKDLFNKFKYDGWAVQCTMGWQHDEFLQYCKEQKLDIHCKHIEETPWNNPDTYFVYNPVPDSGLYKMSSKWLKKCDIPEVITYSELTEERLDTKNFLEQNKKTRVLILQNYYSDNFVENSKDLIEVVEYMPKPDTLDIKREGKCSRRIDKGVLPLLTSKQLERVLENVTGAKINAVLEDGKYVIYVLDKKYKTNTDNLLQAYLQVINQLAGERKEEPELVEFKGDEKVFNNQETSNKLNGGN